MRRLLPPAVLIVGFVASRLLWARAHMPFRADTIDYFQQLLDPPLLQHRLLESLWHLHSQPPLWNAITGAALKLSPDRPGAVLQPVWIAAGLATCLAIASILRDLRIPTWLAVGLALAVTSTPTFLIYEHWYFYPHLATALLAVIAAALLRCGTRPGPALAVGLTALGLLAMLRSFYHPLYVVLLALLMVACAPAAFRRRVAAYTMIAVVPSTLLLLKSFVLFHVPATSSWFGCSLHRMFTESIPPAEIRELIDAGELSPISACWEFSPPETYLAVLHVDRGDTGIPALDATGKTRTRENPVNYNHWIYPYASRAYLHDAMHLFAIRPGSFLKSIRWTSHRFLEPLTDDYFVRPMRYRVRRWVEPFETVQRSPAFWVLVATVLGTFAIGVVRGHDRERLFRTYLLGTVLWVAAVGILLEYGENNRFRYQIGPLLWIAAVVVVRDVAGAIRSWRARRRAGGPSDPSPDATPVR